MTERWIGLNELADETGMSVRNLQYIRTQEPGVLVTRQRGSLTQYKQPDCAIGLRKREAEKARREHEPTVSLDEARTRKALAEAELAEAELARVRAETVTVTDAAAAWGRASDVVVARLRAMPGRLAHLGVVVEQATADEVEAVIDELAHFDQHVIEEPADEAKVAA